MILPTHIAAVVCNAHSDETHYSELVLAYQDEGKWYDINGFPIFPYATIEAVLPEPAVPEGWLAHLRSIADVDAALRYDEPPPKPLTLADLGFKFTPPPLNIRRRV